MGTVNNPLPKVGKQKMQNLNHIGKILKLKVEINA